jgi:hypothetical protein
MVAVMVDVLPVAGGKSIHFTVYFEPTDGNLTPALYNAAKLQDASGQSLDTS